MIIQINQVNKPLNYSMVLLTLEAIWIRELTPSINTKDEFRSRELTI